MICTFRHPFRVLASRLLGNLGMDPHRVQPTQMFVSQLWVEIFHVLEFSQTNCWYRLTEKSIENVGKLWFEFHIAFGYLAGFHQTFFFYFFKPEIFWEFSKMTFQGIKLNYFFGIYVFFGMYLTKEEWISISFWTCGPRFFNWAIWTRNGSKIDFQVLVFKGLRHSTHNS